MPSPASSLATLRPDLVGSFTEFDLAMNQAGFIWNQVFPIIDVAKSSGQFGKIPIEQLLETRDTRRGPGGNYSRGDWTFVPATFATEENGAEEPIDDREAEIYRDYFDAELMAALRARHAVMQNAEMRCAAKVYDTSVWSGASLSTSLSNEWDDFDNATPIADIAAARLKIWDGSGLWANALILNKKQFLNLRRCGEILEAIQSGGAGYSSVQGEVTAELVARVLDLDRLIIGGGAKNTANKGLAASISQIWSDEYAMLAVVANDADIRTPCIGRTFHFSADGSDPTGFLETYRDETVRSDIARCRHDVDEVVLYPEAGHLLSNVTT